MSQGDKLTPLTVADLRLCIKHRRWVHYHYAERECSVEILRIRLAAVHAVESVAFRVQGEERTREVVVFKDGSSVVTDREMFFLPESILADIKAQELEPHPERKPELQPNEVGKRPIKPVTFNIQSVAKKVQPPQHERLEAHPVDFCGDGDQSRISGPAGLITEQENWDHYARPLYQVRAHCPHCGSTTGCMCPRE